jgi:hypothetical protein
MKKIVCILSLAVLVAPCLGANLSTNILNLTDHVNEEGSLGTSVFGLTFIVDDTCSLPIVGSPCTSTTVGPSQAPAAAVNSSVAQTVVYPGTALTSTGTPNTHVPYGVINNSYYGYDVQTEQAIYTTLLANSVAFAMPFCNSGIAQPYPPVAMVGSLPNNISSGNESAICAAAAGVEFSISAGYLGLDTSSASATSASMATTIAAIANSHPTWLWGDIKGALRQTASNWATGYAVSTGSGSALGYGYGNISYTAAAALNSPTAVYLQAPGMTVQNGGYYAVVTLYPFITSRRAKEVVYAGGTWPAASSINEMTAAQITAAGGTKVFDDGGITGIQSFVYTPAVSGNVTFTAITLDSSGNGSRVESFSMMAESFVAGTGCQQ